MIIPESLIEFEDEKLSNTEEKNSLCEELVHLENNLSTIEQKQFLQELLSTGKGLDNLYRACKSSTYKLKDDYDVITRKTKVVEVLHELYYNSLVDKKNYEEDRDDFFKQEKELEQLRKEFIENSQNYAFDNSKYVEYNQRFSKEREKNIKTLMEDVEILKVKNIKLQEQVFKDKHELVSFQTQHYKQKREIENLQQINKNLNEKIENLEKVFSEEKINNEKLTCDINILADENKNLQINLSESCENIKQTENKIKEMLIKNEKITKENENLFERCKQFKLYFEELEKEIENSKQQEKIKTDQNKNEIEKLIQEINLTKEKMSKIQKINYSTMLRNQQLHEKLKKVNFEIEGMKNFKANCVVGTEKVKKRNVHLKQEKLRLIHEVVEMKNDFLEDRKRILSAGKINTRLRKENDDLKDKIVMLKENRSAFELLEDARNLRVETANKFTLNRSINSRTTSRILNRRPSTSVSCDVTIKLL